MVCSADISLVLVCSGIFSQVGDAQSAEIVGKGILQSLPFRWHLRFYCQPICTSLPISNNCNFSPKTVQGIEGSIISPANSVSKKERWDDESGEIKTDLLLLFSTYSISASIESFVHLSWKPQSCQ